MIIVCPTYNRFEECATMVESAYQGTVKPTAVFIYDNSAGKFKHFMLQRRGFRVPQGSDIRVHRMDSNYGCARIWNRGIEDVYLLFPDEHVLVTNDDVTFHEDTLELFERAIVEHPDELIYCAGGIGAPNAFSLFATRYDKMQDSIGMFDEFFLYPYCEDSDYARRMMLAGLELFRVPNASVDHIGSATIEQYEEEEMLQHHVRFNRNATYFKWKWEVDHNNIYSPEGYTQPFDGNPYMEETVKNTIRGMFGE